MFINNLTKQDCDDIFKLIRSKKILSGLTHRIQVLQIIWFLDLMFVAYIDIHKILKNNEKWGQFILHEILISVMFTFGIFLMLYSLQKRFVKHHSNGMSVIFIEEPSILLEQIFSKPNSTDEKLSQFISSIQEQIKNKSKYYWLKNPKQPKFRFIIDSSKYFIIVGPSSNQERFFYEKYRILVVEKNEHNTGIAATAMELKKLIGHDTIIIKNG
ncbi:hypothetical protein [Companilactobacillus ginsenosidimutans]|uniref:Uncharacterized protein n=1 Tax=Companilactobacillus ginsenosidimutans TaxID=1007676 RepID=A0A0H4QN61_9LACO|nr:hypothetical protein [Companilactobacillus ginsenosidimutans]AKP68188.1 hypothetical protein ABM34_12020 [Companilactobacillus ginsenosidimutans]